MNLDDFEPEWHSERIKIFYGGSIGVYTKSLNDWRKIESLYERVSSKAELISQTYWTLLKDCLSNSKCQEVWWIDLTGQFVYIYDGTSICTRLLSKFIEELKSDINRQGYKLSCDERKKIISLESNLSTQRQRATFLRDCFSFAVEYRLSTWFSKSNFHDAFSTRIMFHNCDRFYTTNISRAKIDSIARITVVFD